MSSSPFDAVILAVSPHAHARVLGLTLVERARRVVTRAGATRVRVVSSAADAAGLAAWRKAAPGHGLLVVRAGDQLVHTPLVAPLVAADGDRRIAVGPDGAPAGALFATSRAAAEAVTAIEGDPAGADAALAARWSDAVRVPHGDIARHPATTREERAGATRMMLQLIAKSEDGPVTKYVYRPVSRPLTRLLVWTPITPNQVSVLVLIIGMIGCWFAAQAGQRSLVLGTSLVLIAGFIDGCDGEIARLKLQFSKIGAWLDTVVDELTTTVFFVAVGLHVHAHRPADTWVVPTIALGVVSYVVLIYAIYFFLIVVSKTGNSQHYVGKLEIVDDPALGVGLRARPIGPCTLPPWLRTVGSALAQVIRRDFINLGAVVISLANAYLFMYVCMFLGGVVTAVIIIPEHIRLRGQLRELARRGATPRLLPAEA